MESEQGRPKSIIKPSAQLRESLEEAERCRDFFEREKMMDFLHSLNESYFSNQAKVAGPSLNISSDLRLEGEEGLGLLDLNDTTGGILASVDLDTAGAPHKVIYVHFYHISRYNVFSLELEVTTLDDNKGESLSTGSALSRSFRINPTQRMAGDIDSLLMTFTGELVEKGIL